MTIRRIIANVTASLGFSLMLALSSAPLWAGSVQAACSKDLTLGNGINCAAPNGVSQKGLFDNGNLFQSISNTLIFVIAAISVIMIIIGGLRYALSGGSPQATAGAKDTILYAVIGLIVAILAYAIVNFVLIKIQ